MISTVCYCFIFVIFSLTAQVNSQFCHGKNQYDRCSPNGACGCFFIAGSHDIGICTDEFVPCSELVACDGPNNICLQPNHRCVHHPRCHSAPVCYPIPSFNQQLCPPLSMTITTTVVPTATTATTTQVPVTHNIPVNATWSRIGVTIAGGNGYGGALNQFYYLNGFLTNDDQTLIVADWNNNRIVEWQVGASEGKVIAGGNGQGNRLDQVLFASDVLFDGKTNSVIICEDRNRRVVRWSRNPGTKQGELLLDDIFCEGLAMDEERNLYVSDILEDDVRRYAMGSTNGTLVAGGHHRGDAMNQFSQPASLFVDRQQTVYVSDKENHRIMKWEKGATEGVVVAGNNGNGNSLQQLSYPGGVYVDSIGTVYVTDIRNHRIMRWLKGAQQGTAIAGENGEGNAANQLARPTNISFDKRGNLYVFDSGNQRIQRFSIEDTN
ncbi:unnamed protein product [Rotaria magnacalcarata]|uniref:Uncharacterized protein n=3 Tax=Rotaria magnacalcarata TaxID=392030 RepID=A0A815V9F3_9BILA|nr:unnamed protein product [Rotaria magnacalcarata]